MTRDQIDTADHKGADIFFDALRSFWDIRDWTALDMFARDGMLTVSRYSDQVKAFDCWEMNPEHKAALQSFQPRDIKIGDSFKLLEECTQSYDFIVIDSPQGIYKDSAGGDRVEHFDLFPNVARIMKNRCVLVVYVNKQPYNMEEEGGFGRDSYDNHNHARWLEARAKFYKMLLLEPLFEDRAIEAYRYSMKQSRFKLTNTLLTPCYAHHPGLPPSFRLAMEFAR